MAVPVVYVVCFDFEAAEEEESELTVRKGERVIESEAPDEMDGWVLVEVENESQRSGYVPASYLRVVAEEPRLTTPRAVSPPAARDRLPREIIASVARESSPPPGSIPLTGMAVPKRTEPERSIRAELFEATKYESPAFLAKPPTLQNLVKCGNHTDLAVQHEQFFDSVRESRELVEAKLDQLYDALEADVETVAGDATRLVGLLDRLQSDLRALST